MIENQMTSVAEFPCSAKLQLLGYSIEFVSDEVRLIEAISTLYPLADANSKSCEIQIVLQSAALPAVKLDRQVQFTVNDTQINGNNGASTLFANRQTMKGQASLCREMLSAPYLMRHQIINTICYFLLSYRYVTPLHSCAFVIDDHTYICLGNSGDGKSNLAMAAFEHGFPVLAEDLAFISGEDEITLVGNCEEIHLPGDSLQRFTSLNALRLSYSHNGKRRFIVPLPRDNRVSFVKPEQVSVVFIERSYLKKSTTINSNNEIGVFHKMFHSTEPGFDLYCEPRHRHITQLGQLPSYMAEVGGDASHFFQQLRRLNK